MGMHGIRVRTWRIRVGMQGIRVGMWGMGFRLSVKARMGNPEWNEKIDGNARNQGGNARNQGGNARNQDGNAANGGWNVGNAGNVGNGVVMQGIREIIWGIRKGMQRMGVGMWGMWGMGFKLSVKAGMGNRGME